MARIRTVKPEFWDDEKMATISRDARLVYIGLWNHSDDEGVCRANPIFLKSKLFPHEEIEKEEFCGWLAELEKLGRILKFMAEGEGYYFLPFFSKHQFINRPSPAQFPSPPDDFIEASRRAQGALTEPSRNPHALKRDIKEGKEGKGKEDAPPFSPSKLVQELNSLTADQESQIRKAALEVLPPAFVETRLLPTIRALQGEFKLRDPVEAFKKKAAWWRDKPATLRGNITLQLRNWYRIEAEMEAKDRAPLEVGKNKQPGTPRDQEYKAARKNKIEALVESKKKEIQKAKEAGDTTALDKIENDIKTEMADWSRLWHKRDKEEEKE